MKAFCIDCNKLAQERNYSQATNPQIRCQHCGKRGGHVEYIVKSSIDNHKEGYDNDQIIKKAENSEFDITKQIEQDKKQLEEIDQIDVEFTDLEDVTKPVLDRLVPTFSAPKSNGKSSDMTIRITLDRKTVKLGYEIIDEIGQKLERAVFEQDPKYYGSSLLNKVYEFMAPIIADTSKQVKFPIAKFLIIAHGAIIAPIPIFALRLMRKRGSNDVTE